MTIDVTLPSDLRVGQIWKDLDGARNGERFVRVEGIGTGRRSVAIRTVVKGASGAWVPAPISRASYAGPDRFNGKRGGYGFVEHPHV